MGCLDFGGASTTEYVTDSSADAQDAQDATDADAPTDSTPATHAPQTDAGVADH
jgi:hypothetical protein